MIKIKSLRLENCQSWADETLHLGPGLNAIIANNNVGKSVIFKILKVTCNPGFFAKPERAKLIRYGTDFARATYTFSDDSVAVVTITDKKVIYSFTDADGATYHSEEEPLTQILQHLSVIVEDNSKYLVNVLDSEQSLLLVKSDKKANSDLLKVITEHKGIDRLTALFKEKALKYNGVAAEVKTRGDKIKYKLDNLVVKDIDALKDQVDRLDVLYSELNFLEDLEIETGRLEEALNELSPVDWECFINLLNNVNHIDYREPVGWEAFLDLIQHLPENPIDLPDLEIDWEAFRGLIKHLPEQKVVAPDLDIEWGEVLGLLQHLPEQRITSSALDVDWGIVTALLNQHHEVNLEEFPSLLEFETFVKMQEQCSTLGTLLNQHQKAQRKIAELKSIDFNGTVYECPVHGKIIYNNGKCEVPDVR